MNFHRKLKLSDIGYLLVMAMIGDKKQHNLTPSNMSFYSSKQAQVAAWRQASIQDTQLISRVGRCGERGVQFSFLFFFNDKLFGAFVKKQAPAGFEKEISNLTISIESSTDMSVCRRFLCNMLVNSMWIGFMGPVYLIIQCLSGLGA